MRELWKDIQYIMRTLRREFQLVVAIKFTLIPCVVFGLGWVGNYFSWFVWPTWVYPFITGLAVLLGLFGTITRRARKLESPFLILSNESLSIARSNVGARTFVVGVKNGSHIQTEKVEVVLKKITSDPHGSSSTSYLNLPMKFEDAVEGQTTFLNPLQTKYIVVGSVVIEGGQNFFVIADRKMLFQSRFEFELEASSNTSISEPHTFSVESHHGSGEEGFKAFVMGKVDS